MAEGTITQGRAKRSTAGNRMRELLDKAHQQDDDDLFKEEEDDEEFAEPTDVRDVYLDEFADTDDEAAVDEEAEERELRREEKRKAKGKGKAAYNPLAGQPKLKKKTAFASGSDPSSSAAAAQAEAIALLGPDIDPSTMAPSTLLLAMRRQRREAKRQQRSEVRRSNLRASTLKTAERDDTATPPVTSRKGRKAQHEGGEVRGVRPLSQAELIAEALEEEERNKEELQKWLRREEERRELRRVGRKRVRGPRWTWISRTVGKVVEVVGEGDQAEVKTVEVSSASAQKRDTSATATQQPHPTDGQIAGKESDADPASVVAPEAAATVEPPSAQTGEPGGVQGTFVQPSSNPSQGGAAAASEPMSKPVEAVTASPKTAKSRPGPDDAGPSSTEVSTAPKQDLGPAPPPMEAAKTADVPAAPEVPTPVPANAPPTGGILQTTDTPNQPAEPSQYTRNYLILSQIPGGLPAEMALVLGSHVEWDQVKYIPSRNRPINRRRPICPFTGKIAKYRHPATMIPYADIRGYKEIEAMLQNRYTWSEGGFWLGGEEDAAVPELEDMEGWREAVHGGWMAGFPIPTATEEPQEDLMESNQEVELDQEPDDIPEPKAKKAKKGKSVVVEQATVVPRSKSKSSKSKKRRR